MGRQTFRDESNRKHKPHAEHYVDDKFGKGNNTRNWNKNVKQEVDAESKDYKGGSDSIDVSEDKPFIPNIENRKGIEKNKKNVRLKSEK
jgi:hypothetical protein